MPELLRLPIRGADGRPLVHKFYTHGPEANGFVLLLPGGNYGPDGPMLYYTRELLMAQGWDTLDIQFGYHTAGEELSIEKAPELYQDARMALLGTLEGRSYEQIMLVGKSLSTAVVAQLCLQEPSLQNCRAVYLTPTLGWEQLERPFLKTTQPALMALGTRDRFYQPGLLDKLQAAKPFELVLVEGADHSLDVEGDLPASLTGLQRVVQAVMEFAAA